MSAAGGAERVSGGTAPLLPANGCPGAGKRRPPVRTIKKASDALPEPGAASPARKAGRHPARSAAKSGKLSNYSTVPGACQALLPDGKRHFPLFTVMQVKMWRTGEERAGKLPGNFP